MPLVVLLLLLLTVLFGNKKCDNDIALLQKIAKKTSDLIRYGEGVAGLTFSDEIINSKNGNCGHFCNLMFNDIIANQEDNKLLSADNIYVVGLKSEDGSIHAILNIILNCGKTIACDPTNGFCYGVSFEELMINPTLADTFKIGEAKAIEYTTSSFFNNINEITYFSYVEDGFNVDIVDKLKNIKSNSQFYVGHGFEALFDGDLSSYMSENNVSKETSISLMLKEVIRLQSIIFYPYDKDNRPTYISVVCDNKIIKNKYMTISRGGGMVVNFSGNNTCSSIKMIFSDFIGQPRLILREIKFHGKFVNKNKN